MDRHPARRRVRGFTLVELLIVLTVVALLAAIALPAYRESVAKGARAAATGELLAAHQWMERYYSEGHRYDRNRAGVAVTDASQFPASYSQSPRPGDGAPRYLLVVAAQPQGYTITARRADGGSMAGDACGDFRIDHLGRRTLLDWSPSRFASEAAAMTTCWRR